MCFMRFMVIKFYVDVSSRYYSYHEAHEAHEGSYLFPSSGLGTHLEQKLRLLFEIPAFRMSSVKSSSAYDYEHEKLAFLISRLLPPSQASSVLLPPVLAGLPYNIGDRIFVNLEIGKDNPDAALSSSLFSTYLFK